MSRYVNLLSPSRPPPFLMPYPSLSLFCRPFTRRLVHSGDARLPLVVHRRTGVVVTFRGDGDRDVVPDRTDEEWHRRADKLHGWPSRYRIAPPLVTNDPFVTNCAYDG